MSKILALQKNKLDDYLKVGFIQTVIDEKLAWESYPPSLNMKPIVEMKVWQEIKNGFCSLSPEQPNIIVLPELTLPHGYEKQLKGLSKAIGAIVIAGLDFEQFGSRGVKNKAIVVIPENWPEPKKSKRVSSVYFGKTFFSDAEKDFFKKFKYKPFPDTSTYIFYAGKFGNIGVAICSDFFDIERFVIYRGKIHHMIVIAHNKDSEAYYYLAEAISRLVYCNVVICNTGHYGDSLAFAPYRESYRRTIYRHRGQSLFTTQVVKLPVFNLDEAQRRNDKHSEFKPPPPGYKKH